MADQAIKTLSLRDLREILRARGLNPGGGIEDLRIKLKENMEATGDFSLTTAANQTIHQAIQASPSVRKPPGGGSQIVFGDHGTNKPIPQPPTIDSGPSPLRQPLSAANYFHSPPTSEHAPVPSIVVGARPLYNPSPAPFGTDKQDKEHVKSKTGGAAIPTRPSQINNYSRPGGNQNLGNKITGRPSSRVLAPPGGASQISFGTDF